jgi:hypothetical protein
MEWKTENNQSLFYHAGALIATVPEAKATTPVGMVIYFLQQGAAKYS